MTAAQGTEGLSFKRRALRTIGALWFGTVLLMLLLISMAAATAYESLHGAPAALKEFYLSWWFEGLLALLGVNLAASLGSRWPFARRQVGFVVAHTAIIVILAAALVTQLFATDGVLRLAEGETQTHCLVPDPSPRVRAGDASDSEVAVYRPAPLGFAVTLRQFRLGVYPGGRAPRSFESTVDFADANTGRVRRAVVSMNAPATHGGFTFLQSSYEQDEAGNVAVLRVTRDPGQPLAFLGYGLLLVGLVAMAYTRLGAQSRSLAATPAPHWRGIRP